MPSRPVIGIPADRRLLDGYPYHAVGEPYLAALVDVCDALPLVIPVLEHASLQDEWLARIDGLFLPGSPSDIAPWRYGGEPARPGARQDPQRDATTLALVPRALQRGLPLLGICRGFQEMNVALGGTLWQRLDEVPGLQAHHSAPGQSLDARYAPAHEVTLAEGGLLHALAGTRRVRVNSLHHQGVRRLAPGLVEEARADDGLIEAFRVCDGTGFALGVQWHPEWRAREDAFQTALLRAFAAAAREHAVARRGL